MKAIEKNIDRFGYKLAVSKVGEVESGFKEKLMKVIECKKVALSLSDKLNIEAYLKYTDTGEITREADRIDEGM